MSSCIHSINVSLGGVPKLPVPEARITLQGIEGDRQRNRRYHGGPSRAVCIYSLELIEALAREGHPIEPGAVGENLTVVGMNWRRISPGVVLTVGGAELQVTSFTQPCKTIRKVFLSNNIDRISQARFPGWSRVYARVLKDGWVRVGDPVDVISAGSDSSSNLELF